MSPLMVHDRRDASNGWLGFQFVPCRYGTDKQLADAPAMLEALESKRLYDQKQPRVY